MLSLFCCCAGLGVCGRQAQGVADRHSPAKQSGRAVLPHSLNVVWCTFDTSVQDLVRVDARHRVLLTGTPLQNSLEELFYLMNFLEPHKFSSVEEFKAAYAALNDRDKV